jgi:hypothetical protein
MRVRAQLCSACRELPVSATRNGLLKELADMEKSIVAADPKLAATLTGNT